MLSSHLLFPNILSEISDNCELLFKMDGVFHAVFASLVTLWNIRSLPELIVISKLKRYIRARCLF